MQAFENILKCVNGCILCKLSKEYHENEIRSEFQIRNNKLEVNFQNILNLLDKQDFSQKSEIVNNTLCHLIILYLELQSKGPWNSEDTKAKEKSEKLNQIFNSKYNIDLCETLYSNKNNDVFESQAIFDMCIRQLHRIVTADNFKKHPSLIDVYCLLVKDAKQYELNINPVTVLPLSLLLLDDYVPTNKIKGLQSCSAVLQCVNSGEFIVGNYYEVVYCSLKKNILVKETEVTEALFDCFIHYLKLIPMDIKTKKLHDLYSNVIDQLYTESNLHRKVICFKFITYIIDIHGIHCVKKKVFRTVIHDNLDSCSNEAVAEILLEHVLECLHTWIRYCWCTWILSEGHKILSSLFKVLYLCREDTRRIKIQNLIVTLIKLCASEEQIDILENLQEPSNCTNKEFLSSLEAIRKQITNR